MRIEVRDRGPELLPLLLVGRECVQEAPLALLGQPEVSDAAVGRGLLALDQTGLLGAADELRDRALRQLEALGELGHRRLLATSGCSLDHEEQQVALRRQAGLACVALALAQEGPQSGAEFSDASDLAGGEGRVHVYRF